MKIFFSENDIPKLVIDNALSEEFVEIAILSFFLLFLLPSEQIETNLLKYCFFKRDGYLNSCANKRTV